MGRFVKKAVLAALGLAGLLALVPTAQAQVRPYIGYVYPAGGQQGTTLQVRVGGQGLDDVGKVLISGSGVSANVVECHRRLNNQEIGLLREQLGELKQGPAEKDEATLKLIERIEERIAEFVPQPACASLSSFVIVKVTMDPDALPGQRELTVATPRGVSNPLIFCVGQLPEVQRKPMLSATFQTLGKEELALRKRPEDEVEQSVTLPCTVNGQIASGEVNRYRFDARKGQRLVFSAEARQLVPYIADAVPGWFQPVMTLCDNAGKEVAYGDDYRFKPDPVIFYEVPKDGRYVLTITDALYRGREDFVYRVAIGELPVVTSIFPLGCREGELVKPQMKGWNLEGAELMPLEKDAGPAVHWIAARRQSLVSNSVPFAVDTLPEQLDKEPNDDQSSAQKVELPLIINGRMDRPDDWDVFQFTGHAGDTIVAEVYARRLDSPLDSLLGLTDASGKLLAHNDDREDPASGVNTHHADSYITVKLPADGTYYVSLGDVARSGGEEYGYRLRISRPQPDFTLRVVPSGIAMRNKSAAAVSVHVIRKDGFSGPIKLVLKDPPNGFTAPPTTLPAAKDVTQFAIRTSLMDTQQPVSVCIEGSAKIDDHEVSHRAVPAEDRMQAFLWRHFVPASDLKAVVFTPPVVPPPKGAKPAQKKKP